MSQTAQYPPHFFKRPDKIDEPLYVIAPIFNAPRFRSRLKLYSDFARHIAERGGILYTIEAAFGERAFAVTQADNPRHIQTRIKDELWLKEAMINAAVARLPQNWKYVAWIDADVQFCRPDVMDETVHQLQHFPILQMWSEAHDLGPNYEIIQSHRSFGYCYTHNLPRPEKGDYYGKGKKGFYWHPGYAWACTREAWNALGGLMDHCILGSADFHQAMCLVGDGELTIQRPVSDRYKFLVRQWQARAEKYIQRNIGYVSGNISHMWHGSKAARRYQDRWTIYAQTGYDPDLDLKRDWQQLFQLTDRSPLLRDKLRAYARQRDEDATSVEAAWAETMLK